MLEICALEAGNLILLFDIVSFMFSRVFTLSYKYVFILFTAGTSLAGIV